jgi:hypothetical protein
MTASPEAWRPLRDRRVSARIARVAMWAFGVASLGTTGAGGCDRSLPAAGRDASGSLADAGGGADADAGASGRDGGPDAATDTPGLGTMDAQAADGGPGDGGSGDGGPGDGGPGLGQCPSPTAPPAPLRRLTRFAYNNTVRDLLGDGSRPADSLPVDYWDYQPNDAEVQMAPSMLADGYHRLAHQAAAGVTRDAASAIAFAGCDPATTGESACVDRFIRSFVPRFFRRAFEPDDATELGAVFTSGRQLGGDFASGVRAVVEVALQSPEFLYRVELGEPADPQMPQLGRPTPYEMATRLSYLLWGSAPDAMLLEAAAAGKLRTKEEIAAQARRLLADARAREVVRYFYFQLMRLLGGTLADRPGSTVTLEIAPLLLEETRRFVDEVTWQGAGDFRALLTAPITFLNGPLARFYGVPGIEGDEFRRVDVNPSQRGGLLTQGSVLVTTSPGARTSPTRRGLLVVQQLLCAEIPPPPPEISIVPPNPTDPTATTRQLYQAIGAEPACAGCHQLFDPIGFAFEHYDGDGRWRDRENGQPIDATGELRSTDARGTFDGAIELGARLGRSQDAQTCFVRKWLTFATGRTVTDADACSRQLLVDAFTRTNGNVRELLVALTQTDAFLYRPR